MLNKETKYLKSPALSVSGKQGEDFIISNIINGKQFVVGDASLEILYAFDGTKSIPDLYVQFQTIKSTTIDGLCTYFKENQLIYDPNLADDDPAFTLIKPNHCLFDSEHYTLGSNHEGIVFIGIPFGKGNNLSDNCELTPGILRNFSKQFGLSMKGDDDLRTLELLFPVKKSFDNLRTLFRSNKMQDGGNLHLYTHENLSEQYKKIEHIAQTVASKQTTPFFIGGDHSITLPILRGVHKNHGKVVLIHIDAHTDTYTQAVERVYPDRNHHHGNFVSHALEEELLHSVYQFGIRGLSNFGQRENHPSQHIYAIHEVQEIIKGHLNPEIPKNIPVYLSVDIDVLDPSLCPGTPTPVPGGLSLSELLLLIDKLLHGRSLIGADLVEIHSDRDHDNITVHTALLVQLFILNYFNLPH